MHVCSKKVVVGKSNIPIIGSSGGSGNYGTTQSKPSALGKKFEGAYGEIKCVR